METISSEEEYDSMKSRLNEAMQKSCQWEEDLEKSYTEDQQMDIMSITSPATKSPTKLVVKRLSAPYQTSHVA